MLMARWQELERKYAALSLRERVLVGVAVLAFVAYVGSMLWVNPIFARAQNFSRLSGQHEKELAALQTQLQTLQMQNAVDPNEPLRQSLADVRRQLSDVDARLRSFENALVQPERMGAVLGGLLRQVKGVRLVSLKTLPAESLLPTEGKGRDANGTGTPTAPAVNMFKHGFELKIEGSYLDLLAYLAELEKQPQQLLWQRASLAVEDYPTAVLTVTFFSLSLDKDWLAL